MNKKRQKRRIRVGIFLAVVLGVLVGIMPPLGLHGAEARTRILSAHVGGGSTASGLWANWDETTEVGFATDQDGNGVEDSVLWFLENPAPSSSEIGIGGGLIGDDLILTQHGDIPGATGFPPSRVLDGLDDYFTFALTSFDILRGSTTFTLFLYVEDVSIVDLDRFFLFTQDFWFLQAGIGIVTPSRLSFRLNGSEDWKTASTVLPASGPLYIMIWGDGINYIRAGWSTSKPSKWSDFAAGSRVESALANKTIGDGPWTRLYLFSEDSTRRVACKGYYFGFSTICFIDNNS